MFLFYNNTVKHFYERQKNTIRIIRGGTLFTRD